MIVEQNEDNFIRTHQRQRNFQQNHSDQHLIELVRPLTIVFLFYTVHNPKTNKNLYEDKNTNFACPMCIYVDFANENVNLWVETINDWSVVDSQQKIDDLLG